MEFSEARAAPSESFYYDVRIRDRPRTGNPRSLFASIPSIGLTDIATRCVIVIFSGGGAEGHHHSDSASSVQSPATSKPSPRPHLLGRGQERGSESQPHLPSFHCNSSTRVLEVGPPA